MVVVVMVMIGSSIGAVVFRKLCRQWCCMVVVKVLLVEQGSIPM